MAVGNLNIRFADKEDAALILQFIKDLAEYEHLLGKVVATEKLLSEWIFEKKIAEVIFAELDGETAGFALFFHNFSTFLGQAGIFLEDLYVRPEARGRGIGKALFRQLARIAEERGCGRLEWWCLYWNQPSIDFYLSLGAEPMSEWTVYRLSADKMALLVNPR